MKKIIFLFIAVIACFSIKADPVVAPLPPIINVISFDSDGNWTLDFNLWDYQYHYKNFDSLMIETSSGTSAFKPGIPDTVEDVFITKDNLLTPLNININGDYIKILGSGLGCFPSEHFFYFGNYQYSYVSPIDSTQSYEIVQGMCGGPFGFYNIIKVDFNSPNLNTNFLTGYVLDCDSVPIPNAKIEVIITAYNYETHQIYDSTCPYNYDVPLYCYYQISADSNGHFKDTNLYSRYYLLKFYSPDKNWLYDTSYTINIKLGSINNFNFVMSCKKIFVGIKEIKPQDIELTTYPNPVSDKTTISFMLKNGGSCKKTIIKVFTSEGDLIKMIPVEGVKPNEQKKIILNLSEYPQGHYYYNLELDGKKQASRQIIVIR